MIQSFSFTLAALERPPVARLIRLVCCICLPSHRFFFRSILLKSRFGYCNNVSHRSLSIFHTQTKKTKNITKQKKKNETKRSDKKMKQQNEYNNKKKRQEKNSFCTLFPHCVTLEPRPEFSAAVINHARRYESYYAIKYFRNNFSNTTLFAFCFGVYFSLSVTL